jgi:iron complex transport system substrate-binding protein
MRIVSLLGSATEIVHALGLDDHLVGISHECDYPPAVLSLPTVSRPRFDPRGLTSGEIDAAVRSCMADYGSVYEIDPELLARLRPDVVLSQAVCEVCAVSTASVADVVATLPHPPSVLSLDAHTLEDILSTILSVGRAVGLPERASAYVATLRHRLARVRRLTRDVPPPPVLLLEWLDPPFAPGHWVPEMIEAAGGTSLAGTPGMRSAEIDLRDLAPMKPEVLLVEPCGFDLDQAFADADRHRALLWGVAPDAIRTARAWALDSALFSRSGPRVVDGVELLAHLFHPDLFPDSPVTGARLIDIISPGS